MRQKQPEWKKLIAAIVLLSSLATIALYWLVGLLPTASIGIAASKIGLVTTVSFCLWEVYRRWLWKSRWLQWWIAHPNIAGTWKGTAKSSFDLEKPPIAISVTIKQTFTTLDISFRTDSATSQSYSLAGCLVSDNEAGRHRMVYTYLNEPDPFAKGLDMHFGTAILEIEGLPPSRMQGQYLTARQTKGTITLDREPVAAPAPYSLAAIWLTALGI